ncbi:MAG: polysaccharide deacetylase family protein [Acidobacteriia bacterium]|nr:polysaccharide deacetylase family protein [Terriglobia bacterium]
MPRTWLAVLVLAMLAAAQERRVAITIDDGPAVNELKDLANVQRISNALINSLVSEKVPATIFINERQLNVDGQRDGRAAVLAQWLDAGYDLGNHTYSHPSLNKVPLSEFEDNIIKGEVVMRPLIEGHGRKLIWFRFPFLDSGTTAEVHQKILDFLAEHHYRVAPITVDYKDYIFAGAYGRKLRAGDAETAEKIKQAYLEYVDAGFESAERISRELLGYELPQILLIHCNELNSVTLRDSIARMRKRRYSFVTLEEAMKDPAYQRPDNFTGPGGSWLEHLGEAMGKPVEEDMESRIPKWIRERPRRQ